MIKGPVGYVLSAVGVITVVPVYGKELGATPREEETSKENLKQAEKQKDVFQDIISQIVQGEESIVGTMLESNIKLWIGSDVFYGQPEGLFGQFKDNDRITFGFELGF